MSFNTSYSFYYDLMYSQEKNYLKECDFLERILKQYSSIPIDGILDLACGSGKHSIELAKRGYNPDGVDLSDSMIAIAKKNTLKANQKIDYHVCPMQSFKSQKKFDAAICMFAAFDYLTQMKEVNKAIHNFQTLLNPNGLFVMDFWNEEMFLNHYERFRVKDISAQGYRILRISDSALLEKEKCLKMKITCLVFKGKRLIDEFAEEHKMRFWNPSELKQLFEKYGFQILKICPFMNRNKKVENAWVLNLIARKF